MYERLKPALALQLTHLMLSTFWNVAGIMLIMSGQAALGPTASLTTAGLLVLLAGLMLVGAYRVRYLYLLVTLLVLAGALAAIGPAFYKPATLWPSDFWRFTGVALNSLGVIGALYGTKIFCSARNFDI